MHDRGSCCDAQGVLACRQPSSGWPWAQLPYTLPARQQTTHRPSLLCLKPLVQHGELRPGEVQELLAKAKADLKAAEAAAAKDSV